VARARPQATVRTIGRPAGFPRCATCQRARARARRPTGARPAAAPAVPRSPPGPRTPSRRVWYT